MQQSKTFEAEIWHQNKVWKLSRWCSGPALELELELVPHSGFNPALAVVAARADGVPSSRSKTT
jgi:hypothetical protein